jgi:APA family basic amino acid/polyamine antiporter
MPPQSQIAPDQLERTLGLASCTLLGVGVILGAGIYALVGKAAGLAGNAVWLSFVMAAIVAGLTGLSYAELASFIPRAGGEYHYAQRAFGRRVAFVVSWLLLAGLAVAAAAVALGFAGYLTALTDIPLMPAALGVIAVCTGLLLYGIRESVYVAALCAMLEVGGLVVIIALGADRVGTVSLLQMPHGITGVATAAAFVFFAYIGFEEIVQLAEETREPTRTLPRALLLSLAITTVLYVLVALAAISVLGWSRLGSSDSPLADVAEHAAGLETGAAIAVIALFSTFNTVLVMLMSSARLLWGVAEDGALPAALARVHRRRKSPWVATLAVAALASCVVFALERLVVVVELTNFALFVTFLFINGAVIVLRYREPDAHRRFRVPGSIGLVPIIPALGIASVLAMVSQTGAIAALCGAGLILSGLVVQRLMSASGPKARHGERIAQGAGGAVPPRR